LTAVTENILKYSSVRTKPVRGTDRSPERFRRTTYQRFKSVASRGIAGLMLFVLTPVILLCAGLVRVTSSGPSFYSQVRLGHFGRRFRIYKLRTMRFNCEEKTGAVWASKDDPRVTPVGRVLRRLHLDELPQLWNIFNGDMSFVGPRPERPEIVAKLLQDIPNFDDRLELVPGLTGLSQVLQMADTGIESARSKLRNDLEYQKRESLWLDLRIVVGTTMIIVGVARETVDRLLSLSSKAKPAPTPAPAPAAEPFASSESIFDAPLKLATLWDSAILSARDSGILSGRDSGVLGAR
jgi:lipopolysaccharide/colanic/teichoic acid biosynthesis glycosyltransferase